MIFNDTRLCGSGGFQAFLHSVQSLLCFFKLGFLGIACLRPHRQIVHARRSAKRILGRYFCQLFVGKAQQFLDVGYLLFSAQLCVFNLVEHVAQTTARSLALFLNFVGNLQSLCDFALWPNKAVKRIFGFLRRCPGVTCQYFLRCCFCLCGFVCSFFCKRSGTFFLKSKNAVFFG